MIDIVADGINTSYNLGIATILNRLTKEDSILTNNDILRRIRYTFDFDDSTMMSIFALGSREATRADVSAWLKKDDDPGQLKLKDTQLAIFLNGLITEKRGKKEGVQPEPEKRLGNNIIFVKLKIALSLQAEDILAILELVGFQLSKHELSAFFRKPGHKHYRECKDQVLRNFLHGLQLKHRGKEESPSEFKWPEPKPK